MHKKSALLLSGVAALALAFFTSSNEFALAQNTNEFINPVDDPYPYAICESRISFNSYSTSSGNQSVSAGYVSLAWPLTEKDPVIGIQTGVGKEFEKYLRSSAYNVPFSRPIVTTCMSHANRARAENKIDDFMTECERTRDYCHRTTWTR